MTREEIIHIYENSQLTSEHFTEDALTAVYVAGLAALRAQQTPVKLDRSRWAGCGWCRRFSKLAKPQNSYCKFCGRPLTEEAWAELERKIEEPMTIEDIIASLEGWAQDKDRLAGGDPDSIFAADATVLIEAAKILRGLTALPPNAQAAPK